LKTEFVRSLASSPKRLVFLSVVGLFCLLGFYQLILQIQDQRYVASVARQIISDSKATDTRSKVLALRDYLRTHISFHDAPTDDRPFLRDSAADTLRSGKGYCGEDTRAFICMAASVGIPAQRINLWGKRAHVVAEADLGNGDRVLVDGQNPPQIADLESLDQVILRPEYDDYYTLNLRRLGMSHFVSRIKLEMGPLTYWTENPHALKSSLWFVMAIGLMTASGARSLIRFLLHKRGWIHSSSLAAKPMVHTSAAISVNGSNGAAKIRLVPAGVGEPDNPQRKEASGSQSGH
jgi:hypothetical protein